MSDTKPYISLSELRNLWKQANNALTPWRNPASQRFRAAVFDRCRQAELATLRTELATLRAKLAAAQAGLEPVPDGWYPGATEPDGIRVDGRRVGQVILNSKVWLYLPDGWALMRPTQKSEQE